MKSNNYFIFLLFAIALILSGEAHAQVQSNGPMNGAIKNQNPFFDASTNFNASTNKGKGLVFPQTNLTTFTFIVSALDEITFPTAFNGLIVYNTGTGNTLTTGSNPKTSTAVTPGFYYFSNPNATKSLLNGRWVRINDNLATTIPQGNALPATSNKTGDIFYLVGTGLQVYNGTDWTGVGGSVSGLGTAAYLNVGTSANNVVQLNASGKLPAIDGSQLTNLPAAPVSSVAGQTGVVTLAGMGLGNVNNTSDANKPVSTATQTALNAKMTITTYDANSDGVVNAAATATNLAGGVAGGVAYQSAAGTTAITAAGTAGYLLQSNGAAAPTWVASPTLGTAAALNVGTSANNVVQLNASGKLPAIDGSLLTNLPAAPVSSVAGQTGVVTLAGMGLGNVNNTSDANKPVSTATQTALNAKMTITTYDANSDGVVNAAATATNLAGGVAGGVAYQSAAGTTAITAAGTAGYLLQSNGAAAPTWVASPTLGTAAALNVGTSANNVVQLNASGKLPAIDGSQLTNLPAAPVTSVAGQTGVVTLAGMGLGNVNNTSDANKPVSTATQTALNAKMTITTYDANSDGVVNAAATATNLVGGVAGGVAYQSAAGTTAITAAGTAGYLLQSNGAAAPTWVAGLTNSLAQGSIWVGNSSGVATAVDAKTSAQILIGDGTTIASKALSGDVTMTNTGAVTVNKIKNIPLDFASAPTNGQVLIYDATNTKWIPGTVSGTDEKVKVNGGTKALLLSSTDFYEGVSEITIKTSAVTSDKILDQTIVNADVNASAAIAGTKISPDFGSQNIRTTGYLQLGTPTGSNITASSGNLKVAGAAEIDGVLWTADLKTSSDERLKTNIATLTGALEKINQLRGVSYVFKNQQKYATGPQVGVIAQELQKVYPELVAKGADGYLGVNYSQLTAVLIQAVKEQQMQINKLNERLDKQQQQIDLLFKKNGLHKN